MSVRRIAIMSALAVAGLSLVACAPDAAPLQQRAEPPSPEQGPASTEATPPMPVGGTLPASITDPRIVVYKSQRRMVVYDGEALLRVYAVALGRAPVGDKVREGDRKTPEGGFYVSTKNESSAYHRSLGLSYPNAEDAERGLESGLISGAERDAIVSAIGRGGNPPWDTALGGEIMIHGEGDKPRSGDWTYGCIAVSNDEIEELFGKIPEGAPVTIEP